MMQRARLSYREAQELCTELTRLVTVSTRTYRWRRYDDVRCSASAAFWRASSGRV